MTILIDADGCPVVDITIKIAVDRKIDCVILCDTSHFFERAGARTITVSKGNDSVDFAVIFHDTCKTQGFSTTASP